MSSISSALGAGGYPPSAFYFKVVIGAAPGLADSSFQEASGVTLQLDAAMIVEGDETRDVQALPAGVKRSPLEFRRGIAPIASPLVTWCRSVFEGNIVAPIVRQEIEVYLMGGDQAPIRAWLFADAFPVKWEVDAFNSNKNVVAIEKISLTYSSSKRLI